MVRRRTKTPIPEGPLARTTLWQGLQPHDAIRVKGKPGQRRRYEFLAFVQNTETGECFIEVLGGRLERDGSYQRNVRMFPPELCSAPPRKRPPKSVREPMGLQMSFVDLTTNDAGVDTSAD
jgi:hypothetical protein